MFFLTNWLTFCLLTSYDIYIGYICVHSNEELWLFNRSLDLKSCDSLNLKEMVLLKKLWIFKYILSLRVATPQVNPVLHGSFGSSCVKSDPYSYICHWIGESILHLSKLSYNILFIQVHQINDQQAYNKVVSTIKFHPTKLTRSS